MWVHIGAGTDPRKSEVSVIGIRCLMAFVLGCTLWGCGGGDEPSTAPPAESTVVITQQPTSQTARAGTAATFGVAATGSGLSFQWQRSAGVAVNWVDIQGATTANYTVAVVDSSMGGHQFRVLVSSGATAVPSTAATLTVTPPEVPTISVQPTDQAGTVGGNASFTVTATGYGVRYQWQVSSDGGSTWSDLADATASSMLLSPLSLSASGRFYRANVSNDGGSVPTRAAALTVSPALAAPTISLQPVDAAALAGATATFSVTASGYPAPSFQWERSTDDGKTFTAIVGANLAVYTTPALVLADDRTQFRVVASNSQGSVTSRATSLMVSAAVTMRKVSLVVNSTSCATRNDSVLACWGTNDGGTVTGDRFSAAWYGSPTPVVGMSSVSDVASGTCAVRADATLSCWGMNWAGQFGLGAAAISTFFSTPPTTVPGLSGVVQVAMGSGFTCARRANGTVVCFGQNDLGQLGDGTTTQRPSPTLVPGLNGVVALAAGHAHACALKSGGTVACWGLNRSGAVGDGTTTNRSSPVTVAGLSDAIAISAGGASGAEHTCAVRTAGTVVCWGSSSSGQTGAIGDVLTPHTVSGITDARAIAASNAHTCVVKVSGTVACWGINVNGELGTGSAMIPVTSTIPLSVSGLGGVVAIAAGAQSTCAVREDGSLYCWGYNGYGQLGDGTTTSRSNPTRVPGFLIQLR